MVETLRLRPPALQGDGPFGTAATGPFTITSLPSQPPSALVAMTIQTGVQETKPFQLLLAGQHAAELAMTLMQFLQVAGIALPQMPGARTGWQTAVAEEGKTIVLRVLQNTGLQVDLVMTPEDAMKLRDELDQRCKDGRDKFAVH